MTLLGEDKARFFEGCLSLEGFSAIVPRAQMVQVEYLNEQGEAKSRKLQDGMPGFCSTRSITCGAGSTSTTCSLVRLPRLRTGNVSGRTSRLRRTGGRSPIHEECEILRVTIHHAADSCITGGTAGPSARAEALGRDDKINVEPGGPDRSRLLKLKAIGQMPSAKSQVLKAKC